MQSIVVETFSAPKHPRVRAAGSAECWPRTQSSRLAEFGGLGISFNICRGTLGSLAMFTAIRNASSRVSCFALDSPPGLVLVIDIRQRLLVVVAHDKAGGAFLDQSGWQEAAGYDSIPAAGSD